MLALALVLMAACFLNPEFRAPDPLAPPSVQVAPEDSDLGLYDAIVERVRHGGNYYQVAAEELRSRPGYPLRPFVTFRMPTLAKVQALLPPMAGVALLYVLVASVALAWIVRIMGAFPDGPARIVAALLLGAALFTPVQPILYPSHEVWSGLLIALSLGVWRPGRWVEAMALGAAAMLIRELAVLYVLVMLGFALLEGRRREALGWIAGLAVFAAALGAHAWAVGQVTNPVDPASEGWSGLNGFWFFVQTVRHTSVLEAFPFIVSVPVVVLAILGWASWRDPAGARMLATIAAYALLIGLAARLNNFYWGLMIGPVILLGLTFAPDGVRDLVRAARGGGRRITVTRVTR